MAKSAAEKKAEADAKKAETEAKKAELKAKKAPKSSKERGTKSLEELIEHFQAKVDLKEEIDSSYGFSSIFSMLVDICSNKKEQEDKISSLEKQVDKLQENVTFLENSITSMEIEASSAKIIIRGAPLHKEAKDGREYPAHSLKVIGEILEDTKTAEDVTVVQAKRIYYKEANKLPSLSVQFLSKQDVVTFMRSLRELKKSTAYKAIRVSREVPHCLRESQKVLENQAWEIRKNSPGTKTLIITRALDLQLLVKEVGKKDYVAAE